MGHAKLTVMQDKPEKLLTFSGLCLLFVWVAEEAYILSGVYVFSLIAVTMFALFAVFALKRASPHVQFIFVVALVVAGSIMFLEGSIDPLLLGLHRAEIFGAFIPAVIFLRASLQSVQIKPNDVVTQKKDVVGTQGQALTGNYILGSLLNVGSIHLLAARLIAGQADNMLPQLARASALGLGTAVMWSPFFVSMGFVSQMIPQTSLAKLVLISFGASIISLVAFNFFLSKNFKIGQLIKSLILFKSLFLPLTIITLSILFFSYAFNFSGPQSVVIVGPLLAMCWISVKPKQSSHVMQGTLRSISRVSDELIVLMGAMILGASFESLPWIKETVASLNLSELGPELILLICVLGLVGLGQIGVHPMIGTTIIVPLIASSDLGISPVIIGATCVFSWGISAAISIWTLPVSVASSVFKVSVTQFLSFSLLRVVLITCLLVVTYFALLNRLFFL
jgi:hypothetical protein